MDDHHHRSVPESIGITKLENTVAKIPEVVDIHDMHIWSLDGEYHAGTVHIVVKEDISLDRIVRLKREVRDIMMNVGVQHVTIEIEREREVCDYKEC